MFQVREFVMTVQEEVEAEIYGGLVKAPKVLADIIESLAAAVYIDCNLNLEMMWKIIRNLLEPMVMLDALEQQPQPVTLLFELCQKDGKQVDIKYWAKEEKIIASVFVDGQFVTSASSEQKENAKLNAAKDALRKLSYVSGEKININTVGQLNGDGEIEAAKQKLHEQCGKKKWPRPVYQIQKEDGRAHEKRYICSVEIEIGERILFVTGKEKARVKDAESSAASVMLHGLKDLKYI
ncbi:hypothetical protein ACS0TY_032690 [Phlomoides rotata]